MENKVVSDIVRSGVGYCATENWYPKRYPNKLFDDRDSLKNDNLFMKRFKDFKNGLNPNTGRNIKKNGKVYGSVKKEFNIKYKCRRDHAGVIEAGHSSHYHCPEEEISFEEIDKINYEKYKEETSVIKEEIDKKNNIAEISNTTRRVAIDKINKLDNWDDYIEYEGIKYGIPPVINNIHRKNNCYGNIKFIDESTTIDYSNDRPFMSVERTTTYLNYGCDKCSYTYIVGGSDESIMGPSYSGTGYCGKPKYW